ncbi:MAG TPA: hypothetical protein VIV40_24050 [Kofleriaceae bacterium]
MRHLVWFGLLGCGGGDGLGPADALPIGNDAVDVGPDAPMPPTHHYVANQFLLPMSTYPEPPYSLDLTGDGVVDNKFARMFVNLGWPYGTGTFSFLTGTTRSIDSGELVDLFELATDDYATSQYATFLTLIGGDPVPAGCIDSNDTTCRRHLDGNGQFTALPTDATPLVGTIANGTFLGGPGHAVVQLTTAGSSMHIVLPIIGARAQASMPSDDGIVAGILAGGVRVVDIDLILLPALRDGFTTLVNRDCNDLTAPPQCGCTPNSDGKSVAGVFDTSPRDCVITVPELRANPDLAPLLTGDLTIEGVAATSIGVGFTAVRAAFAH